LIAHAAHTRPDLVIHVGDYLYREKPCSKHVSDCPNVRTGYGWKVWEADFFKPSAPLLAAAPWIMVRGNHETCRRAGEGWFRFLDAARPGTRCPQTSDFFVVSHGNLGFVVMDSAAVPDAIRGEAEDDDDEKEATNSKSEELKGTLRHQFNKIAGSIPPNTWLLTHVPFNSVRVGKKRSDTKLGNTLQRDAVGVLPAGIKIIISGHIHMFEALNFADSSPPQLVVGTGSTRLSKRPEEPSEIDGVAVKATVLKHFGYMVWDRDDRDRTTWNGVLLSEDGAAIAKCHLAERSLRCKEAD